MIVHPGFLWPEEKKNNNFVFAFFPPFYEHICFSHGILLCPSYPDAIGAQLQHLQVREVLQVGNAADFVVKQK